MSHLTSVLAKKMAIEIMAESPILKMTFIVTEAGLVHTLLCRVHLTLKINRTLKQLELSKYPDGKARSSFCQKTF